MNAQRLHPVSSPVDSVARPIVLRTRGRGHGDIVRLVSPADVGELIKPFVFLDSFDVDPTKAPRFGWHPHSGIATVTVILEGTIGFAETTGRTGTLDAGGVEWMRAGGGVWHSGNIEGTERARGFQLWMALRPELENGPAESAYLRADEVAANGPARVVLGRYGRAASRIRSPSGLNYLDVHLNAGERWTYQPPAGHTVGWAVVHTGALRASELISSGELAVFAENDTAISFEAVGQSRFVLGSAIKHPHPLVLGHYSVHTSATALQQGEAQIEHIRPLAQRSHRFPGLGSYV